MPDDNWDHLSDEQLDRITAHEADTARGLLALLDRIEALDRKYTAEVQRNSAAKTYIAQLESTGSTPLDHTIETANTDELRSLARSQAAGLLRRADEMDELRDRIVELEAERDEIPRTVLATASWNPTVVLQYLVDTGVLVKCYAVPDSPHVARGRFSWGLFANPGDRGKEDVVELWERVDTLPPLIGGETEEGGSDA